MSSRTSRLGERSVLSRDLVITTALEVLVREGDGGLNIRAVAARLGVTPMALYRHVAGKDDLMDEVADRLLADRWQPDAPDTDWRAWITEAADRLRGFLVEQPVALHVHLRHPVVSSSAARRMDACITVLAAGLGSDQRAHRAYAAVQSYTVGFAALEAHREAAPVTPRPSDHARSERLRELADHASPSQFRAGLAYLLDGVAAAATQPAEARPL